MVNPYSPQQSSKKLSKTDQALADVAAGYESDRSSLMGLLRGLPQYKSSFGSEFEQLRGQAFGQGPLDLYEKQREASRMEQMRALEGQSASQAGQIANAYSQLGMGGGLSSGARERIASGGATSGLFDRQRLRAQGMQNLAGIGTAEAGARMDMQRQVADAITAENQRKQQFEFDRAREIAQAQAGLLKGRREQEIAIRSKK